VNKWILAASAAAFATFLIHTLLGGWKIARPLLASRDLQRVPRYTCYFCWHMVTILLLAMSMALAWSAANHDRPVAMLVFLLAVAFCLLSAGMVIVLKVRPWRMPQWSLFALIAILAGTGLFK